MKRVVVTGLGIVSCIGNTKKEVVHNLKNLNSGIVKAPEYEKFSFRSLVHGKPNINLEENLTINMRLNSFKRCLMNLIDNGLSYGKNFLVD